jgi:LacI family transcriptional regulator
VVKKRPTIDDVARLADVSIKTVSRVFNNGPNVRQTTRDRVFAAAKQLEYQPNQSARRLAANRTFVIGMLYDNPDSDYVIQIQTGALRACRAEGYHLLIHPLNAESPGLIEEVIGMQRQATVDGFVVLQPVSDVHDLNRAFVDQDIPAIRISQRPFQGLSWVSVTDKESAAEMTEHLLELGHRRIGFIVGHPDHGSSHDRLAGYRDALKRHHVAFDDELVEQGLYDHESGYSCAKRLLSLRPRPTAVFASDDHMAIGVLAAAHEIGLEIPRQLSVAGFDDTTFAGFAWPPLTTVSQPVAQIAQIATEVLLEQLQGRTNEVTSHRIRAELVVRESTGQAC